MKLNLTILGLCLLGLLLTQTLAYHESKKLKMEHETEEDPKATEEVAKAPQAAPGKASGAQTPNLKGAAGRKAAVQDKKTVYKTKSELEEEKESNNKASQIFTSKPEGRDGFDVVVEGELTLQLLEAGKEDEAPALPYHFRLNKNALYYSDRSRSYRGVFGAFPIENMVSGDDVPESGKCCSRLSPVKQAKIKQSGRLVSLSCFKLTGTVETWNLCSKDDNLIRDWNKKLKIQIIVSALIKKGKTNVEVMIPDDKTCENNNDWTWRGQNDWKCMCKDGKNQSPLVLSTEKSKNVMNTRLVWNYVPVNNAQAKFNGHEVEVFGEFGKFVKQKVDSQKTYSAYKVSFKFPSEHMIDGNKYDGEILVHHKDEEDKPAILSILLIEDFSNEAEDNEFIDNVDAETWKHDELASIAIESKPSLEQIVRGGATKFLKKSFFWYQGSTTTPPCEENVLHVVMRDPVKVPSAQFQIIRKVAFPNNDESEGNARKPFEPNDREVSVHLDMSPTCENSQTHALIQDVEDKITEEASKDANKESDSVPQKFVKATNTIASYGMTGGEPITGDIGNGITLNIVKPDEVPEKTKKNLVKEATEIYKSIKRRAAEEAKLEVDAKNKEAALKKSAGDNGGDVKAAEQEIQAEVVKALNRYY